MAIIQSSVSSDSLIVDPISKSARVTLYDMSGNSITSLSNVYSSSTISSLNDVAQLNLAGQAGVSIQISSTNGTLTASFESTIDGTHWFSVAVVNVITGFPVTSTTIDGTWIMSSSGYSGFRVRISSFTVGAMTVSMRASPVSQLTTLSSATISEAVVANQGAPNTLANSWGVKISDGYDFAGISTIGSARALKVDVIQSVGAGSGSSNFGSLIPASGTIIGFSDGTNMQTAKVFDGDTGAGTEYILGSVIRLPASGGSVIGGTSSNPIRIDTTGTTTQPISVTSLPLPTGAATSALQSTGNASLSSIDSKITTINTGAVTISSALPTGSNVIGHVITDSGSTISVSNFPATQPVSGTITANIGTTNGLALDTSLTSLSAKFGSLGQKIMSGSTPVVIASDQSAIAVTGSFFPATQPVSGTVTANLGTLNGAATAALQTTGNSNLSSIDSKITAVNTGAVVVSSSVLPSNASQETGGNLEIIANSVGPVATIGSMPNNIIAVGAYDSSNDSMKNLFINPSGSLGLLVDIATLGQKTMAASAPVVIASNQSAIPVTGTFSSASTGLNNAAIPTSSTQLGGSDGTNLQAARIFDLDSGAGTEYDLGISLRLPGSGGSVAGGTSANPIRIDTTGTTTQPISGSVTANLGTLNGAATSALQTSGNTSLSSIDGKITAVNTGAVVVSSSALPSGASTSALQGGGLPAALGAGGGLKVDGSGTALPVSGTITSNIGTTNGLALDTTLSTLSGKIASTSALADATANPTVTSFGSFNEVFNGTTWDRVRGSLLGAQSSAVGFQNTLVMGRYNLSAPTLTDGQMINHQLDSSGNLKVNLSTATASLTIASSPDTISTGTITANGQTIALVCPGGDSTWNLGLTGTFSATSTIAFEGTIDGTNWFPLNGRQTGIINTTLANSTIGGSGPYLFRGNTSGMSQFRARCSAFQAGDNISVTIRLSFGIGPIFLNSSIPAGTNSIGTVDTELPAAVTLADASSNPTAPAVDSRLSVYNGTTWDRARSGLTTAQSSALGMQNALVMGIYNTSAPTLTNGQTILNQVDVNGNKKVNLATALPTGSNYIGRTDMTPTGVAWTDLSPAATVSGQIIAAAAGLRIRTLRMFNPHTATVNIALYNGSGTWGTATNLVDFFVLGATNASARDYVVQGMACANGLFCLVSTGLWTAALAAPANLTVFNSLYGV